MLQAVMPTAVAGSCQLCCALSVPSYSCVSTSVAPDHCNTTFEQAPWFVLGHAAAALQLDTLCVLSFTVGFTSQELEDVRAAQSWVALKLAIEDLDQCFEASLRSAAVSAVWHSVWPGTVYGLAQYMAQACGMLYYAGA